MNELEITHEFGYKNNFCEKQDFLIYSLIKENEVQQNQSLPN